MFIQSNVAGLQELRDRITLASSALPDLLVEAAQQFSEQVVQELSEAAPKGTGGGGSAPEGDASGPLSESFVAYAEQQADSAMLNINTTQPTKLSYVTEGTGIYGPKGQRIVPVQAQALFWEGAPHPFRSVAGQKPNDFVSPVIDAAGDKIDEVLQPVIDEISAMLEG